MTFQKDEQVVWVQNGEEIPAVVVSSGLGFDGAELYQIDTGSEKKHVQGSELLFPKKPGFQIRDLAFVINENREAIEGEITATGYGPNKRRFFQLMIPVGEGKIRNWYSEDELFIMSSHEKRATPRMTIL